jgi:hypothetical protein
MDDFEDSDFVVRPLFNLTPGDFVPNPLMDLIQENFREQFHAADVERPPQFPGNKEGDDQRVHATGETPRNRLGETAIMFFGHA